MKTITQNKSEKRSFENSPNPWPDAVNGQELYKIIQDLLSRYMVMSKEAVVACSLWVFYTYVLDAFEISPRLFISSPEKRCGKTRLLSILQALVHKPLSASNITSAVMFRVIDKFQPTLLIDEADTMSKDDEGMRSVLNAGHNKENSFCLRCAPTTFEPKIFTCWAAIVLASIKESWPTLMDRSIVIHLRRKTVTEKVSPLKTRKLLEETETLPEKLIRWGQDNAEILSKLEPSMPNELNDRATDNWEPLIAIAELLGVGEEAFRVAQILSGEDEDKSIGIKLLYDLKLLFDEKFKWSSADLIEELCKIETSPWGTWNRSFPIKPQQLAKLLEPFFIKPKELWIDTQNKRGYIKEQFEEAFSRYLDARGARNEEGEGIITNVETLEIEKSSIPLSVENKHKIEGSSVLASDNGGNNRSQKNEKNLNPEQWRHTAPFVNPEDLEEGEI